ncbi:MAG: HAD family hydrolase [Phycisphaerae bacterium]|nr:HAD family hydrolase [Phycisphaerae bacterium]
MPIRAVAFDLDDTLYPEHAYVESGFAAVARAFADRLAAPFDLLDRMKALAASPDRGRVFNMICAEARVAEPDALAAEMVDAYRRHVPNITLFPDAAAALARLHGRYRLALISDGYAVSQNAKLDTLGIRPAFDAVYLTDDWGRQFWKPHPRAFEAVMQRFALPAPACAYVSDNPAKDFVAPNALGWRTVRVLRPGGVYADATAPPGGEPSATVPSLDVLEAVLAG